MFSELLLVRSGVTNQQIQLAYLHDQMVAHRGPVCECCSFQKSSSTTLDLSFTTPMLSNTAYARVREFTLAKVQDRKLTLLADQICFAQPVKHSASRMAGVDILQRSCRIYNPCHVCDRGGGGGGGGGRWWCW